jgi:hypothetical protein
VEQAESIEELRFQQYYLGIFRMWENIHYQWNLGLYEDSEFAGEKAIWSQAVNRSSVRGLYCSSRDSFSAAFQSQIEEILERPC